MVHHTLLLELRAHALHALQIPAAVEFNTVQVNFHCAGKTRIELALQLRVAAIIGLGDVQDEFVELQRIIVPLAQFELPGADVLGVVEDVFEVVEVHERAFEFAELHLADLRTPRNFSHQPGHLAPAEWARLVDQSSIDAIARAIAQDHAGAHPAG